MSLRVRISIVPPAERRFYPAHHPAAWEAGQATLSQRTSSGIVGRFPYDRMPTRKIFAVIQKKTEIVTIETAMDRRTCHIGGSATSVRTNMVSGPNTGASEKPIASDESGFVMIAAIMNHGSI